MMRFNDDLVCAIGSSKMLKIRAGTSHRFIRIWVVVVGGRVFVRSWSMKPRSWYRTFLVNPEGKIWIDAQKISVRAVRTRSEQLKRAVDAAYLRKYNSAGERRFAKDLTRAKSKATTTELVPF